MKVTKQSLNDWQVTNNGKHVAWIHKDKIGYYVEFKGDTQKWYQMNFKEAKAFAFKFAE